VQRNSAPDPPIVSNDNQAAIGVVTISADLAGLALNNRVVALRRAAHILLDTFVVRTLVRPALFA
jgi:putative drug exporter of the RND superfamily